MKGSLHAGVVLGLLIVGSCAAQVKVAGKVTDDNGRAVAAVRVEFRSAGSAVPIVVVTDVAGSFALDLPAPGGYRVHAERTGFFVFDGRIEIQEAPNQLHLILNRLQEFFQTVDVAYSAPAIDPQQPSERKEISNVEILEVPYPASQDLRNSLPLLPGVVHDVSGRLHFNGGATDQTAYSLDGFNVSDPVTGRFDARLNIESVQEVEVESSAFSAALGRGSAASVDVRTAMGDDSWRFGATNFVPGISSQNGLHLNKWTPRIKVSGPLRRGRAWFHNGFDTFYDVDAFAGLPRGQDRSRAWTTSNLTRVQVNLNPSNILTASLLHNYVDDNFRGLSFLDPLETTVNRRQKLFFTTLRNQIYFASGALVELGFADSRGFTGESPQGDRTFEILPAGRRGNYFVDFARHTYRQQWIANAWLPALRWAGSHQLRFGVDVQRSSFERYGDRHDYRVLRADESVAREVRFAGSRFFRRRNFEPSEYLQDRWTPRDSLLIEAGLRLDWDQVAREVLVSPRLAVAWAPRRLGGAKIAAGLGVFHDALNLGTISRHLDQSSFSTFYSPSGALRRGPVETAFLVDDRDLHVPRYQTLSVSVEHRLPLALYGKASYIRRVGQRGLSFYSDVGECRCPWDVEYYHLRNWRNDRYDALELTLRRTFGGRYEWFAGYTTSSSRSDAVVDYSLENPIFAAQGPGPFAWDTPHRFLTWGWAPLPARLRFLTRDTTVAYLIEYRTGFPFSVVNEEGMLVGRPNERRLPSYFNINLHFERRFRFLHYLWAWRFGVNNLTNSGNPNVVNNNIDSPGFLTYGRGQQRAVNVRLRFLGRK